MRKVKILTKEIEWGETEVSFTRYVKSRTFSDSGITGYFHKFISNQQTDHETFSDLEVIAIIELEDGKIELFDYDLIQFIKEEEK